MKINNIVERGYIGKGKIFNPFILYLENNNKVHSYCLIDLDYGCISKKKVKKGFTYISTEWLSWFQSQNMQECLVYKVKIIEGRFSTYNYCIMSILVYDLYQRSILIVIPLSTDGVSFLNT